MSEEPSLLELYEQHQGYVSDKWERYLHEYQRLFSPLRDKPINLLEIGVQNGGSLEIWRKFFKNANRIVGCDINPACAELTYTSPEISVVIGDVNSPETLWKIAQHGDGFDIIIDDGSHISSDIKNAFCSLFPLMKIDGLYIAEDLHCSYWHQWQGGLARPSTALAFFKTLVDIINFEHWGLKNYDCLQALKRFSPSDSLTNEILFEIHSIEFINSMCVITRRPAEQNFLGVRKVAGVSELVSAVKDFNERKSIAPDQTQKQDDSAPDITKKIAKLKEDLLKKQSIEKNLLEENLRLIEEISCENTKLINRVNALEKSKSEFNEKFLRANAQLALLKEIYISNSELKEAQYK